MASTTYSRAFVLSSLLVILFFAPSSSDQREDLIFYVCHRTADPQFCITFFDANLPPGSANTKSLVAVTLRQSLIKATNARIFVEKLIASSPSKALKDLFTICDVSFKEIEREYLDIQLLFAQNNYPEVLVDIDRTEVPVNNCLYNVTLSEDLNKMSLEMKLLIDMSHVIVHLL